MEVRGIHVKRYVKILYYNEIGPTYQFLVSSLEVKTHLLYEANHSNHVRKMTKLLC